MINRRDFVKSIVFAGAAAKATIAGRVAPSDQVTIAVIGVKGRGNRLTGMFADLPDANIAYLREGRLLVEAARKYKRVVQHGTQARSRPAIVRAMEYIGAGKLGTVLAAKAWNVQMRDDIGRKPDSAAPPGLDYDTWTGPAPLLPFNENRFHYKWHWHWNYGTGDVGDARHRQSDFPLFRQGAEQRAAARQSAHLRDAHLEPVRDGGHVEWRGRLRLRRRDASQHFGLQGLRRQGATRPARRQMGADPKTSVLNQFNQTHDVRNLFVADGAAFASCPEKNPTLTIMALAWRACDYLAEELKRGKL